MPQQNLFGEISEKFLDIIPTSVVDVKKSGTIRRNDQPVDFDSESALSVYSEFHPEICKLCYELFLRDATLVFDPFAGWGERHHYATLYKKAYRGFDLNQEAIDYAKKTYNVENAYRDTMTIAENDFPNGTFNGVITSPPYWCFDGMTNVITSNGIKFIKDININDLVFTHSARWKRVTEIKKHNIKEEVNTFRVSGSVNTIISTKSHPFYALKINPCIYDKKCLCRLDCARRFGNAKRKQKGFQCNGYEPYKSYKPSWIQSNDLECGDFIAYPINREIVDDALLSLDLCYLIGLFIAEGCAVHTEMKWKYSTYWTFNKDEQNLAQLVQKLLTSEFCANSSLTYQKNTVRVNCYEKKVWEFFLQFGYKARNKQMPIKYLSLPIEKQKKIIKGIFDGDGWRCHTSKSSYYDITSSSSLLIEQLRMFFHRIGVTITLNYTKAKSSIIDNRMCEFGDAYHIVIADKIGNAIMNEITGNDARCCKCSQNFILDNYAFYRIRKKRNILYHNYVYNLEVEEDHSYTLTNGCVHNCRELYADDSRGGDRQPSWEGFLNWYKNIWVKVVALAAPNTTFCVVVGNWRKDHKYYDLVYQTQKIFDTLGLTPIDMVVVSRKNITKIKVMIPQTIREGYTINLHEILLVYRK